MSNLSTLRTQKPIKMLLIGNSGTGKTGALASLAKAGYRLVIQDYDNGLESLAFQLKGVKDKAGKPAIENVFYKTLQDHLKSVGNMIIPVGEPKAFSQGLSLLDKWSPPIADEDLGSPSTWDSSTIIVIDSLTFMSQSALRRVLAMNGRSGDQPQIQDWGAAMSNIEDMLTMIYSDTIKCHIIITSHITYIETGDGKNAGYPSTLGNKLPPKVGRWFNQVLYMKSLPSASGQRRVIFTQPYDNIEVKSPIPGLPKELSIESGLADFFLAASKL